MQIIIQQITPSIAAEMLKLNVANRPLNKKHVDFLAAQMASGSFVETGDTIKFCPGGSLLDGQHRLSAIVQSGVTVSSAIAKDVPTDSFQFIDTGRNRLAADVIAIAGFSQATKVAACARFLMAYGAGSESRLSKGSSISGADKGLLSNSNVLKFVADNNLSPHIEAACHWYKKCRLITTTEYSGYHYIFSKKDVEAATSFFESFSSGVNLQEGSPILVLRRRFEQIASSKVSIASRARNYLIISAWNSYRLGKKIVKLQYDPSYKMPEII